jgi:hypothetical protein
MKLGEIQGSSVANTDIRTWSCESNHTEVINEKLHKSQDLKFGQL